jgi:hypothetical protein
MIRPDFFFFFFFQPATVSPPESVVFDPMTRRLPLRTMLKIAGKMLPKSSIWGSFFATISIVDWHHLANRVDFVASPPFFFFFFFSARDSLVPGECWFRPHETMSTIANQLENCWQNAPKHLYGGHLLCDHINRFLHTSGVSQNWWIWSWISIILPKGVAFLPKRLFFGFQSWIKSLTVLRMLCSKCDLRVLRMPLLKEWFLIAIRSSNDTRPLMDF